MQRKKMLPLTDDRALVVYLQQQRFRRIARNQADEVFAVNFSGNEYATLASRAIDPDGDIDVEFYAPSALGVRQAIISQQINLLGASEFYIESDTSSRLVMVVGATAVVLLTTAQGYEAAKKYRVRLVGTALTIWETNIGNADTPLRTATFTRGATREPSAITVIGAAVNTTAGTYTRHFVGIQRDVKINGVLWKMNQINQTIQPSEPVGNNMTLFGVSSGDWVSV